MASPGAESSTVQGSVGRAPPLGSLALMQVGQTMLVGYNDESAPRYLDEGQPTGALRLQEENRRCQGGSDTQPRRRSEHVTGSHCVQQCGLRSLPSSHGVSVAARCALADDVDDKIPFPRRLAPRAREWCGGLCEHGPRGCACATEL